MRRQRSAHPAMSESRTCKRSPPMNLGVDGMSPGVAEPLCTWGVAA